MTFREYEPPPRSVYRPGQVIPTDNINHPSHYIRGRKFEPIDVIEDWDLDYHLGNALKYISRAGRKGDAREDIKKAIFYLKRWLEIPIK